MVVKRKNPKPKIFDSGDLGYSPLNEAMGEDNKTLVSPGGAITSTGAVPFGSPVGVAREMVRMSMSPISEIASGRVLDRTLSIAPVSPVLGQYAGRISYSEDWGCISKNTLVVCNPEAKEIQNVSIGERVLCVDGRYHRVTAVLPRPYDGEMWRFRVARLRPFATELTPDHRCLIVTKREYERVRKQRRTPIPEWIPASSVSVGDFFVMPRISTSIPINYSDQDMWLFGMYIAEGSSDDSSVIFDINIKEIDLRDRLVTAVESFAGRTPSIHPYKDSNGLRIQLSSRKFVSFIQNEFGRGKSKRIPQWVVESPHTSIKAFINGWYDGDGNHLIDGSNPSIKSSRLSLAWALYLLVTKIGWFGGIRKYSVNAFGKIYGQYSVHYNKIPRHVYGVDGFILNPVVSKESFHYNDTRYDLTVDDQHNFVASSGVIHNSYWEYISAYLMVPEVQFAVNLKNRLMWSPGWTVEANNNKLEEKIMRRLHKMRFQTEMRNMSKTAIIMGNGYATLVTDGDYTYLGDHDLKGGADDGSGEGETWGWKIDKEPTKLYGFKHLDPRTMRRFVSPWNYDNDINDIEVVKFIQRAYNTPLGHRPSMDLLKKKGVYNEIPLHPNITLHMRFKRILASTYGYSILRETLVALKGFLIMYQFLPLIVQKRADPLLHAKFGGNIYWNNQQMTILPRNRQQLDRQRSFLENRNPGDDLFTDFLTNIEEVYKTPSSMRGLDNVISIWDRRIWKGMNIPYDPKDDVAIESLLNETREDQEEIEEMVNRQILPLVTSREVEFKFNDLVPDDWMSKSRVVQQLYQSGLINADFGRYMLGIPADAGIGAVPISIWGQNPTFQGQPALAARPPEGKPPRMKSPKAQSDPNYKGLAHPLDKGKRVWGRKEEVEEDDE